MPIELEQTDEVDEAEALEPGEEAYEALCAVAVDADELTLMGLLSSIQRGEDWAKLTPAQRGLCVLLEGELYGEAENGGD